MVRIGDQVHTSTFAYLCVYTTITDSVVPYIIHRNKYKNLIREKLSKFSQLSFCQKLFFSEPNSFMNMFNVSTLYRQSIKLFYQKLW